MNKIRINELARELEVKAHEIIDRLPELGVTEKKTHSSSIDEDVALRLRRLLANGGPEEYPEPGPETTPESARPVAPEAKPVAAVETAPPPVAPVTAPSQPQFPAAIDEKAAAPA